MVGIAKDFEKDELLDMLYKEVAKIARRMSLPYNGKKFEIADRIIDHQKTKKGVFTKPSNKQVIESDESETEEVEKEEENEENEEEENQVEKNEENEEEENEEDEEEENEEDEEEENEEDEYVGISEYDFEKDDGEPLNFEFMWEIEEDEEKNDDNWTRIKLPVNYLTPELAEKYKNNKLVKNLLPRYLGNFKKYIPEVWYKEMMGSDWKEQMHEAGWIGLHPRIGFLHFIYEEGISYDYEFENAKISTIKETKDRSWEKLYKKWNK